MAGERSDAKRKELETRKLLGPRLGRSKSAPPHPTVPPSTGRRTPDRLPRD